MAYRDDLAALAARHEALFRELAALREEEGRLADVSLRAKVLEGEIAEVAARLAAQQEKRALPLLEDLRIASPCSAKWEDMAGDDRVRFCGKCKLHVYDLSAMTRAEAEALVAEREGDLCARMYRRADGTVLTADCPVGRRRRVATRVGAALALGGAAAAALVGSADDQVRDAHLGGAVEAAPGAEKVPMPEPSIQRPRYTMPLGRLRPRNDR